jgi:hypothetical protein
MGCKTFVMIVYNCLGTFLMTRLGNSRSDEAMDGR